MPVEPVETTGEAQSVSDTTPPLVPATTPEPNTAELLKAAKEEAWREAQSHFGKREAEVHRSYQQKQKALLDKTKDVLKTAGFEDADRLEQQLAAESELDEYRAVKGQMAAQQASFAYGEGLVHDIADNYEVKIAPNDSRLWGEPFENWDQFKGRVRTLAKQEVAAKRVAEKAALEAERRDAVDARVASGELNTLGGVPAGAVREDADTLTAQLMELQKQPTKNREAINKLSTKLEALMRR